MAASVEPDDSKALHPRKNLEEEYLDYEAKVKTMVSSCSFIAIYKS